jgi:ABC-2 type transport system permease protein
MKMFSKALYKQSCKANGIMWAIITFAVCFMLACVMLISGSGSVGKMEEAIEDTIIQGEIDSQIEKRSINYYNIATDGEQYFDKQFVTNFTSINTYDAQISQYLSKVLAGEQATFPTPSGNAQGLYALSTQTWLASMPNNPTDGDYTEQMTTWQAQRPNNSTQLTTYAYQATLADLQAYEQAYALSLDENNTPDSQNSQEIVAVAICAVDPSVNDTIKQIYGDNNQTLPSAYDVTSLLANIATSDKYIQSEERENYRRERAQASCGVFLGGSMTSKETIDMMVSALASYGITAEKYESFGYTFEKIQHASQTTIISYQGRYDYELGLINEKYTDKTTDEYKNAVIEMNKTLTTDLSNSLLASLPQEVSDALQEVGQMDLYSLIVGSIFFKMAGLLLPIIYMIMTANALIAGQVDSGSMAYVLSTSTKRKQVTFTQATYLVTSLLAMFSLTTITSVVCLAIVKARLDTITLTYGNLILLNVGAFVTMFALSGISFLASCWFNRSKYSMSVGGGLNMFFLVATMLGLFGSKVLPSVVRLSALNFFNYTSLISLFDVVSILDGTTTFIWKFAILIAVGLGCYILGSKKFEKKDLPL